MSYRLLNNYVVDRYEPFKITLTRLLLFLPAGAICLGVTTGYWWMYIVAVVLLAGFILLVIPKRRCPHCGKKVWGKKEYCPNCDRPITGQAKGTGSE